MIRPTSRLDFGDISYRQKRRQIKKCSEDFKQQCLQSIQSAKPQITSNKITVPIQMTSHGVGSFNIGEENLNIGQNFGINVLDTIEDIIQQTTETNPTYPDNENITDALRNWINDHHISHRAANDLLKIMKKYKVITTSELPNDVRTLMKTPRNSAIPVINIGEGHYAHLGLKEGIIDSLEQHGLEKDFQGQIKININIDGLPISKSSGSQFWPILGEIVSQKINMKPFVIGIFHGKKKPQNVNEFLECFVKEAEIILESGINLEGKNINLTINAFICDAPAKAFIGGIKGHNGYFACSKCVTEGEYVEHSVVFPEISCPLRTDESFRTRAQPEHHVAASNLERLNIGMVTQIPLDYMHLVCLGVTKRLLQFWVKGDASMRLKPDQLSEADAKVKLLTPYICNDFARRPRSLTEVDRWKATEFRLFLLYTGPVIMKNILSKRKYEHFLSLSIAIRILCNKTSSEELLDYANSLLRFFVKQYSSIYGLKYLSYNVHNLIHLYDDVKKFGSLDEFSAFTFENYMYQIKQKVKNSPKPLEQIVNRLSEERKISKISENTIKYPIIHKDKSSDSLINFIQLKYYSISSKPPDSDYLLKSKQCFRVNNIILKQNRIFVEGWLYNEYKDFFVSPCNSSAIDIFVVHDHYNVTSLTVIEATEILCKCVKLKFQDVFVLIPLIHTKS